MRRHWIIAALALMAPSAWAEPICTTDGVAVSVDFPSGGRHTCTIGVDGAIVLAVVPEGRPINGSPWYAFRLETPARKNVRVTLDYGAQDEHRYAPQTTMDGRVWRAVPRGDVVIAEDEHRATIRLTLEPGATYVSAQPILTPTAMHDWARALAAPAGFEAVEYGRSVDGRPLIGYRGGQGTDLVVAMTRQHPPETTGATAFRAFVERLLSNDADAVVFRQTHRIVLAPVPNPDGVIRGHWRWGAGGMDLNRDWRDFTQPETQTLSAFIQGEAANRRTIAFFDFHSTARNVVYAPPLDAPSPTIDFLPLLKQRLDAAVERELPWTFSHSADGVTSKRWALEALHAPGLTMELDDDASDTTARRIGTATADALIAYANGTRAN